MSTNMSTKKDNILITSGEEHIKKTINCKSSIVNHKAMIDDLKIRRPDITKSKTILKWSPEINFYDRVSKVIEYFENRMKKWIINI